MMRNVTAWGAAAMLAAAGCGGSSTSTSALKADEHAGPPAVCQECKVTGGGTFIFENQIWTFGLNAIPLGNGGVQGHIELQGHQDVNIFGDVTAIVECRRTDQDLLATFTGVERDSGKTFTVTVVDAGEPGRNDTFAYFDSVEITTTALDRGGNLQVHDLDRCRPPPVCDAGFCIFPDTGLCETCPENPPPPPFQPL